MVVFFLQRNFYNCQIGTFRKYRVSIWQLCVWQTWLLWVGNSDMTLTHKESSDLCWTHDDSVPCDWVKCEGHTNAGGATEVVGVAHVALTAEGTPAVHTLAIPTQVGQNLTLINICGKTKSHIQFHTHEWHHKKAISCYWVLHRTIIGSPQMVDCRPKVDQQCIGKI